MNYFSHFHVERKTAEFFHVNKTPIKVGIFFHIKNEDLTLFTLIMRLDLLANY